MKKKIIWHVIFDEFLEKIIPIEGKSADTLKIINNKQATDKRAVMFSFEVTQKTELNFV